jgi:diaminohydroxyphosphoribosylaminopyrimidine deaminase/5-amino-6-(5-phosphoribosylamino)uracil reductase
VARVFYATPDPNPMVCGRGAAQLENAGIAVAAGLLADAAGQLNPGFLRRMQSGRPFVRAKIAMSLDAKVTAAAGAGRWITSPEARADVQRLRAEAGAILTGVGTVIADDPALTVRDPRFDPPGQPIRAIVDTRLRLPPRARLLSLPGRTVVFCAAPDAAARAALRAAGADVHVVAADAGRVDLGAVLESLGESQVNEVLVEAGPVLTSQMLLRRLIDELIVYLAPRLIGEGGRHAFPVSGDDALRATAGLKVIDTRRVGPDWRLTALIN